MKDSKTEHRRYRKLRCARKTTLLWQRGSVDPTTGPTSARRRTQVVKGEVCKTSMQRFESARRLCFATPDQSDIGRVRSGVLPYIVKLLRSPHRAAPKLLPGLALRAQS